VSGKEAAPHHRLLRRLATGSTLVSDATWLDQVDSTNAEVTRRAADGAAEGLLVIADEQTAGRGRLGRSWQAPPGTSLMLSLLLRPSAAIEHIALLPLLAGLALVEASDTLVTGVLFNLKWPNDLLAGGRKCAGILVEVPAPGVVVVGLGVNVDWRAMQRPPALANATSLSEVAGGEVDRWQLLPVLIDRLDRHYRAWRTDPAGFLPAYRERCSTLGRRVRIEQRSGELLEGTAARVADDGGLLVETGGSGITVRAGDVHHLRHD
jgi:BirA family biotin operon repressor/biotin-[acetyl-CoA-carboxylase] ligase